jgi:quercetin dioxygenase-like cupin family protein
MSYKPSPRPSFTGPTPIPYASVTRHLWGDDASGRVDDWIYVSSMQIHQLVFGLAPGEAFKHSESFRTVFAADEVLTVLQGTMVIANPETGEVAMAKTGESIFFRRDTWHHAWAWGKEELRVLEFFAPPPARGTSGAYAKTRPYVDTPVYSRPAFHGAWPQTVANPKFRLLRDQDMLLSLDTTDQRVMTGIIASTEELTAAKVTLQPGGRSGIRRHGGAAGFYVTAGRLNILLDDPEADPPVWFELHPGDGFYMPENAPYRLFNMGAERAEVIVGVAPHWDPPE